jgi:quercetin dioxygenase-like cupin family protein
MATSDPNPQSAAHGRGEERRESASEAPALITQGEMQWGPAPDVFPAGAQFCLLHGDPGSGGMFTVRLKAAHRYVFAPHSHPHDEHITVISGRLELGNGRTLDRSDTRVLEAGAYAFLPKEQFHYAWTGEEDAVFQVEANGPFAITYADPADDPRTGRSTH